MTLVSDIIADAYRKTNLLAVGQAPTTPQVTEALRLLNRLVKSVFGNEVGEKLEAMPIGHKNIQRPAGYPWYGDVPNNNFFVPTNTRLIFNLEDNATLTMYLHPDPPIGCRVAYNVMTPTNGAVVTMHGNGRYINGTESITITGTPAEAEYIYRDDLAQWVKYSPLASTDTFPFPEEFDNFFIIGLAMEINPGYGVMVDAQAQASFKRSQQQIRARYHQGIPTGSELALVRLAKTAIDRDRWRYGSFYDPTNSFIKGWPW